ncbi:hypothetical protein [Chlorobium sp.]|uniref:hypothetical protein n=1 Tax=Chlorobium sp. TaxID=1095 RepID=UPI003C5E0B5B
MSFIDQIEAIYDSLPLEKLPVPEWETAETGEVFVHYKPATQYELELVTKEIPENAKGSRFNVQLVILKALDSEGKRLFVNGDAERLSKKGFINVVNRLANAMVKTPTIEGAEGN